jgi:hypothetical protein
MKILLWIWQWGEGGEGHHFEDFCGLVEGGLSIEREEGKENISPCVKMLGRQTSGYPVLSPVS